MCIQLILFSTVPRWLWSNKILQFWQTTNYLVHRCCNPHIYAADSISTYKIFPLHNASCLVVCSLLHCSFPCSLTLNTRIISSMHGLSLEKVIIFPVKYKVQGFKLLCYLTVLSSFDKRKHKGKMLPLRKLTA